MVARLLTGLVWLLAGASAVAWGLALSAQGKPVPAGATLAQAGAPVTADWSKLLGNAPVAAQVATAAPAADARFKLIGVVAPRSGQRGGLALLSIDGKPPRALGVGREVEPGGLKVLSIQHREVGLGQGDAVSVRLSLPVLPEATRGVPPGVAGGNSTGAVVVPQGLPGRVVSPPPLMGEPVPVAPGIVMPPGMTPSVVGNPVPPENLPPPNPPIVPGSPATR